MAHSVFFYLNIPNKLKRLFIKRWITTVHGERCKRTSTGTPIKRELLAVYRNCKTPSCLSGGFHVKTFSKLPIPRGLLCVRVSQFDEGVNFLSTVLLEPYQCELDKVCIFYSSVSHNAKQYLLRLGLKREPTFNTVFFLLHL